MCVSNSCPCCFREEKFAYTKNWQCKREINNLHNVAIAIAILHKCVSGKVNWTESMTTFKAVMVVDVRKWIVLLSVGIKILQQWYLTSHIDIECSCRKAPSRYRRTSVYWGPPKEGVATLGFLYTLSQQMWHWSYSLWRYDGEAIVVYKL